MRKGVEDFKLVKLTEHHIPKDILAMPIGPGVWTLQNEDGEVIYSLPTSVMEGMASEYPEEQRARMMFAKLIAVRNLAFSEGYEAGRAALGREIRILLGGNN